MRYLIVFTIALFATISCGSQKETVTNEHQNVRGGERKGRPSVDDVFKMDANNDGKLSKDEVKGPLERQFSTIDTDGDGFISRTELENAPKPQRGQRPPKQ